MEELDETRPANWDTLYGEPRPNTGDFMRETRKKINEIIRYINSKEEE